MRVLRGLTRAAREVSSGPVLRSAPLFDMTTLMGMSWSVPTGMLIFTDLLPASIALALPRHNGPGLDEHFASNNGTLKLKDV